MSRAAHIDPLKLQQLLGFKKLAAFCGYAANIRDVVIRSKASANLNGAFEGAAGYELAFFQDADDAAVIDRQQEPKLKLGQFMQNEFMTMAHGLYVEVNQQGSGLTQTEVNELIEKLGEHLLEVKINTKVVAEVRLVDVLTGSLGIAWHSDGQGTPITARGLIQLPARPYPLLDPRLFPKGSTIEARVRGNATWTGTDTVTFRICMDAWAAEKGERQPPGEGVSMTLSEALEDMQKVRAQIAGK